MFGDRPRRGARGHWIAWPKLSAPLTGELKGDDARSAGLTAGLADFEVCAIDADRSDLKFQVRKG